MQHIDTTKYNIHLKIDANGIVEQSDIVGAIFGQTEGLLGSDLDIRDLQKTGRIGRIEVAITSKMGKSKGTITISSSLNKIETSVLAASLETIEKIGPCTATVEVTRVEDIRSTKRQQIIDRAKVILNEVFDDTIPKSQEIAEEIREAIVIHEIKYYGKRKIPCGPTMESSDDIIIVEGRADVLNLLRYGIKNTVSVGGTNVPNEVVQLTKKKNATAFTDGDRGGKLIIKELLQVADIDFIARAPRGKSVEDLIQKEIVRALQQKQPIEQVSEEYAIIETELQPTHIKHARLPKRKEISKLKSPLEKGIEDGKIQKLPPKPIVEFPKNIPQNQKLKIYSEKIIGTFGAKFLDSDNNIIKKTSVRDLIKVLKKTDDDVKSVIFDGIVTQRILDIAMDKGVENIIGAKIGHIAKTPISINISTVHEL